jgi:hypothetical protein
MSSLKSRDELIDYSLRKLGSPVIEINVDRQQCEDRLDEALELFAERHFDGSERELFVYTVTQDDIDNKYINTNSLGAPIGTTSKVSDKDILSVVRVFQFGEFANINMFDVRYQMALMDYFGINRGLGFNSSQGLARYDSTKRYISMIQDFFQPEHTVKFSKITNRISLDMNWSVELAVGKNLLIEAFVKLSSVEFSEIFDDIWLKKYITALIKQQWGQNMSKFEGVQLPGGVQMRGAEIMAEAKEEVVAIEEELKLTYEVPIDFMKG